MRNQLRLNPLNSSLNRSKTLPIRLGEISFHPEKKWRASNKHHLAITKPERRFSRPSALSAIPSRKALVTNKVTLTWLYCSCLYTEIFPNLFTHCVCVCMYGLLFTISSALTVFLTQPLDVVPQIFDFRGSVCLPRKKLRKDIFLSWSFGSMSNNDLES